MSDTSNHLPTAETVAGLRRELVVDLNDRRLLQAVLDRIGKERGQAAALIESQRATIERVEREAGLIGAACDKLRVAHSQEIRQGLALRDELRSRAAAAEARVTALEAEKAGLREALEPFAKVPRNGAHSGAKYDRSPVFAVDGHELTVGHFRRARQTLSRSSTEDRA